MKLSVNITTCGVSNSRGVATATVEYLNSSDRFSSLFVNLPFLIWSTISQKKF